MSVGWGAPWTQHWSNWSHKARNASIGRSLRYFSSWILSVTKNKMPRQKINAWLMAHMTGDSWPSVNLVHWCGTLSHLNIKPWKEAWICVSPTLCSPARTQLALEVVEEASLHDHDRRPLQTSARSQGRSDSESVDFWSFFDSWRMGWPLPNLGSQCIAGQRFDNTIRQTLCSSCKRLEMMFCFSLPIVSLWKRKEKAYASKHFKTSQQVLWGCFETSPHTGRVHTQLVLLSGEAM